jgi:hypothetical protein
MNNKCKTSTYTYIHIYTHTQKNQRAHPQGKVANGLDGRAQHHSRRVRLACENASHPQDFLFVPVFFIDCGIQKAGKKGEKKKREKRKKEKESE